MQVKIEVQFEVEAVDPEDHVDLTTTVAKDAAARAAFDFLSLVEVSGYSSDSEEVEVHVDGFGKCTVRLSKDEDGW